MCHGVLLQVRALLCMLLEGDMGSWWCLRCGETPGWERGGMVC